MMNRYSTSERNKKNYASKIHERCGKNHFMSEYNFTAVKYVECFLDEDISCHQQANEYFFATPFANAHSVM